MTRFNGRIAKAHPAWAGLVNVIFQQLDARIKGMDDGTHTFTNINVGGGTVDATEVGTTTPRDGNFSSLAVTGGLNIGSCLKVISTSGYGTQLIQAAATDKVAILDTVVLDNHSAFDIDNSRFTPARAGWYELTTKIGIQASAATKHFEIHFYKNGAVASSFEFVSQGLTQYQAYPVTIILQANGTTDYFEVYVTNDDSGAISIGGGGFDEWIAHRMF